MRNRSRSSVVWLVMAAALAHASVSATDLAVSEPGLRVFVCDDDVPCASASHIGIEGK